MMKLLFTSVTRHMPQNRVSNTIMHVTLNIINNVVRVCGYGILNLILKFSPSPLECFVVILP